MWEIEIAKFLYHPKSVFGIIFECIGEAPALMPFVFGIVILFRFCLLKRGTQKDIYFSIYLMLVVFFSTAIVFALKTVVNRTRFYDLLAPDYLGYTPFYSKGSGGESFPSGHAAMSTLSLLFYDIVARYKLFKRQKLVYGACLVFIFLTCLSRMLEGAHFITDVAVGVTISLGARYLLKIPFKKLDYKS